MPRDAWEVAIVAAAIVSLVSIVGTAFYITVIARQKLVVATTTSLYDTGLLDAIEVQFEEKHNIDVYFVSVGTGIALQFAQRGDADMILVHSPSQEFAFLEGGYGVNRKIIAYNFFVIVGPNTDPAGIRGLSVTEGLSAIVSKGRNLQALWVSRGDNSGTHSKEKHLWDAAGFDWEEIRDELDWFIETGSGMGSTLKTANELQAYTLADIGTFLAYTSADPNLIPNLIELVTREDELLNVYSAIAINQTLHKEANFQGAITFIKFLISKDGQYLIEEYGKDKYDKSLFFPAVDLLQSNADPILAQMIRDFAFFENSECPPQYRSMYPELYDV
ncbi:MAG: substrate-binding domain-containing protein [Candidatus Bathyarchaeota archaeon]|nr:MAG: substrate-binding domain-containing protein [Candidatus Bathyarchaeota archaeon]